MTTNWVGQNNTSMSLVVSGGLWPKQGVSRAALPSEALGRGRPASLRFRWQPAVFGVPWLGLRACPCLSSRGLPPVSAVPLRTLMRAPVLGSGVSPQSRMTQVKDHLHLEMFSFITSAKTPFPDKVPLTGSWWNIFGSPPPTHCEAPGQTVGALTMPDWRAQARAQLSQHLMRAGAVGGGHLAGAAAP